MPLLFGVPILPQKLEKVQQRAIRRVKGDFSSYSSVTRMQQELGWMTLEQRCTDNRHNVL